MDLRSANSIAPQDLLLRTDFVRYCEAAEMQMQGPDNSTSGIKNILKQSQDPFIIHCPEVTVFRGSHEDGYPFYEEPVKIHVIAYALHSSKPEVQVVVRKKHGTTEWYASQAEHRSLIERLDLIARVGHKEEVIGSISRLPILISCVPGCMGLAAQPLDALGSSLK